MDEAEAPAWVPWHDTLVAAGVAGVLVGPLVLMTGSGWWPEVWRPDLVGFGPWRWPFAPMVFAVACAVVGWWVGRRGTGRRGRDAAQGAVGGLLAGLIGATPGGGFALAGWRMQPWVDRMLAGEELADVEVLAASAALTSSLGAASLMGAVLGALAGATAAAAASRPCSRAPQLMGDRAEFTALMGGLGGAFALMLPLVLQLGLVATYSRFAVAASSSGLGPALAYVAADLLLVAGCFAWLGWSVGSRWSRARNARFLAGVSVLSVFGFLPLLAGHADVLELGVGAVLGLVFVAAMLWAVIRGREPTWRTPDDLARAEAEPGRWLESATWGVLWTVLMVCRGLWWGLLIAVAAPVVISPDVSWEPLATENAVVIAIMPGTVFATVFAMSALGPRVRRWRAARRGRTP